MEAYSLSVFKRIRAESPRLKCRDLKNAMDNYIEYLAKKEEGGKIDKANDVSADKYFEGFQLAFESRFPRVMEIALGT